MKRTKDLEPPVPVDGQQSEEGGRESERSALFPFSPEHREHREQGRGILHRLLIILSPSALLVVLLLLFPSARQGMADIFTPDPLVMTPNRVFATGFDRIYHDPEFFLRNQILAYYGHPLARFMGIIGRFSREELGPRLKRTTARYDRLNGRRGVIPAFYLIYGTAQPEGRIQLIPRPLLDAYIRYTAKNGFLLILDHQIGRYGPRNALRKLLPFLKYPHVHLAMDPEWRTRRPMKELGWISGEELNVLQAMMKTYMFSNGIPGRRMLIVHQFEDRMMVRREKAKTDYDPVLFIHSISGWGSPGMKRNTWARGIKATNMPHKAFKLWYDPGIRRPGLHYDSPLMSPEEVLSLKPSPQLIIYQ